MSSPSPGTGPRAIDNPTQMDQIPRPDAANTLTPRQYQAKWMTEYDHQLQLAGGPPPDAPAHRRPPRPARRARRLHRRTQPRRSTPTGRSPAHASSSTPTRQRSTSPTTTTRPGTGWSRSTRPSTPSTAASSAPSTPGRTTGGAKAAPEPSPAAATPAASASPSSTPTASTGPTATAPTSPSPSATPSPPANKSCGAATTDAPAPPTSTSRSAPTTSVAAPNHSIARALPRRRRPRPDHAANQRMQLLMDQPLSLDEVRTAVTDLTAALIDHQPLDDDQWDHAITTLLVAREQHGGRIRQLIQTILDVGHGAAGRRPGRRAHRTPLPPRARRRSEAGPTPRRRSRRAARDTAPYSSTSFRTAEAGRADGRVPCCTKGRERYRTTAHRLGYRSPGGRSPAIVGVLSFGAPSSGVRGHLGLCVTAGIRGYRVWVSKSAFGRPVRHYVRL